VNRKKYFEFLRKISLFLLSRQVKKSGRNKLFINGNCYNKIGRMRVRIVVIFVIIFVITFVTTFVITM